MAQTKVHPIVRIAIAAATTGLAAAAGAQPLELELRLDDSQTLSWDGGPSITVAWQEVQDSRCAVDVVCVWEGEVAARLEVRLGAGSSESLTLTRQHDGDERATATVDGFTLRLAGVDPVPLASAPPQREDYVAHLLVAPPGQDLPRSTPTAVAQSGWAGVKQRTRNR